MEKYEYLTCDDLGYMPGVVEGAKFEYSPLGEALNEGLKKDDKVNQASYDNDLMCITLLIILCLILIKYHHEELISIYKREYNQVFKSKDKDWRQKYDYKNLKDLDYQLDQLQPDESMLPKWVKVTNNRFDVIQSIITESKKINWKLL